jgi:glutamyl-tRNA synthetase
MRRNIEIKAILRDRNAIVAAAAQRSDTGPETISQHDFFFRCTEGRLKLRVLEPGCGELIRYERDNVASARCSRYQIARTSDPDVLLDILTRTLGRLGEVKKTRILYLIGQTRVHIDQVEGLGDFLELEVVLGPDRTEAEGKRIAEELLRNLGIRNEDLIAQSYVDLLARPPIHSTPSEAMHWIRMSAGLTHRAYRGRLAPSPTGLLHVGHARTFWIAAQRASGGTLILRNEDLDPQRCRPEFVDAMFEDLHWLGISWQEGPDCGGPVGPYTQSERRRFYSEAWKRLLEIGAIYPCTCSRKDVALAAAAPNDGDDEPMYSGKCRPAGPVDGAAWLRDCGTAEAAVSTWTVPSQEPDQPAGLNWRFRVPDGEEISFTDFRLGPQCMVAGRDFGDFIVWRRDDVPAYQLAVAVDDAAMQITEVVRGADLLKSTARQVLLYRALQLPIPDFYHCDLIRDEGGVRLAKRHDSLSIRKLRDAGWTPEQVRTGVPPGMRGN